MNHDNDFLNNAASSKLSPPPVNADSKTRSIDGVSHSEPRLGPTFAPEIVECLTFNSGVITSRKGTNIAIGMQVLLGSLTTGLAVVISGHQAQVVTAVLGSFATLVASYLARARGSNEPELSIARVKDLEHFIRECEAFKMDYGHDAGRKYDMDLTRFRDRFEGLLGNANGERKLSPPV